MNRPTPTINPDAFKELGAPLLLLAGPGTGKTYQLAKRIQFLVDDQGVDPDAVTVITYTSEAAAGMREKLREEGKPEYLDPSKRPKRILTMHSLGFSIVNQGAALLGMQSRINVVSDSRLRAGLMRDAAMLAGIEEADAIVALGDKQTANLNPSAASRKVLKGYDAILRACNAVDFDDQISLACDLLGRDPALLTEFQKSARHLLIDEYQDINADQDRLIRLLMAGQEDGLFAVGDDDQSIYGFRGGDPKYIREFSATYPDGKIQQLQESRRCLKNILDCAVALVEIHDPSRSPKARPTYSREELGSVTVWDCPSERREAELIAKSIYRLTATGEAESFFILVPTRNYVQPIADALRANGVPHEVATSNERNLDWEHLQWIRSWLEEPSPLLTRHLIELLVLARTTKMPSHRVRLEEKTRERREYALEIAGLWRPVIDGTAELDVRLEESCVSSPRLAEFWAPLKSLRTSYASGDLLAFLGTAKNSFKIFEDVKAFYRCLYRLRGDSDASSTASKAATRILTYQSSKGLEADCVFVVALEESGLTTTDGDPDKTAEDARLLFVAMTRAKKQLHLHHVRTRTGASTYQAASHQLRRSAFLDALPKAQYEEKYVRPSTLSGARQSGGGSNSRSSRRSR